MCGIFISSELFVNEETEILIKNRGPDYFCRDFLGNFIFMVSVLNVRGAVKQPVDNTIFMLYNGEIYNDELSDTLYLKNLIRELLEEEALSYRKPIKFFRIQDKNDLLTGNIISDKKYNKILGEKDDNFIINNNVFNDFDIDNEKGNNSVTIKNELKDYIILNEKDSKSVTKKNEFKDNENFDEKDNNLVISNRKEVKDNDIFIEKDNNSVVSNKNEFKDNEIFNKEDSNFIINNNRFKENENFYEKGNNSVISNKNKFKENENFYEKDNNSICIANKTKKDPFTLTSRNCKESVKIENNEFNDFMILNRMDFYDFEKLNIKVNRNPVNYKENNINNFGNFNQNDSGNFDTSNKNYLHGYEIFEEKVWNTIAKYEKNIENEVSTFFFVEKILENLIYEHEMALILKKENFIYFLKDDIGKRSLGYTLSSGITISSVFYDNEVDSKYIYAYSIGKKKLYRRKKKNHFLKPLKVYVHNPLYSNLNIETVISHVSHIITNTLKNMLHDYNPTVFFSGGVDSFLICIFLSKVLMNKKPIYLINTEFITKKKSKDRITGKQAFKELQENITYQEFIFIENDVLESEFLSHKDHIKKLIHPKKTMMDLNIAACLYFSARKAKEYTKVVFLGCGADELFCGYNNHKTENICLKTSIYTDMQNLFERNLGRDDRVISDNGLEGRYPFLTKKLINFVLNMNQNFLIRKDHDGQYINKYVLRKILEKEGFLRASKLKKTAMQFGSGMQNLEKLMKK